LRKKVAVFFLSKSDFDEYACKFVILKLNTLQDQDYFEFEFPEVAPNMSQQFLETNYWEKPTLFGAFSKLIENLKLNSSTKADFFVGITKVMISEDDLFWTVSGNQAVITTKEWQKKFSPPSVFEYLIQSLAGVLVKMCCEIQVNKPINEHSPTRGCILDYANDKKDAKVDISLGYICDDCKAHIESSLGKQFAESVEQMCSRDCLGEVATIGSLAYDLKKFFRVDVEKDTGFNKTLWEKAKGGVPQFTREFFIVAASIILTIIVTHFFPV